MLENCTQDSIQPISIDVRLASIFSLYAKGIVDYEHMPVIKELKLPYVLKPGEYGLARTVEKINQQSSNYGMLFFPRSRAERIGLLIQSGVMHPFYKGEMIFGIKNIASHPIRLSHKMGVAQVCFFDIKSNCVPLQHLYSHGKVM